MLSWLRGFAGAVSHADMGPYSGAPRNPELRIGDEKSYSTVLVETQQAAAADAGWIDESRMPAVERARAAARKTVV